MAQDQEVLEEELDQVVLDQVVLETMELGPEVLVQVAKAQVWSTKTLCVSDTQQTGPAQQLYFNLVSKQNHQLSLPLCELYNKWKFVLLHHKYCSRTQFKAAGYGLHTCTIISLPDCREHLTYFEATFPYEHTYGDKG